MNLLKEYYVLLLKGMGMGAANVIPGVSGGTIAFISGIYEELIDSLKSFDATAVKLLLGGKFKELSDHVHLPFLVAVFAGIAISILSLSKLLEWLFTEYPVLVWSFFFGLILASVYFVGKTVERWSIPAIISLLLGTAIAVGISLFGQVGENDSSIYLFICGIVAICSMILPGLSGSYILILMGNYMLVLTAVKDFNFAILVPLAIGCVVGLILFSHLLSWIFKHYRDITIALLTGFILGSLKILWPWQVGIEDTKYIKPDGEIVYTRFDLFFPDQIDVQVIIAFALMLAGILSIWAIERMGVNKPSEL